MHNPKIKRHNSQDKTTRQLKFCSSTIKALKESLENETFAEIFGSLVQKSKLICGDDLIRKAFSLNPKKAEQGLMKIAEHADPYIVGFAARCSCATKETLVLLSKHNNFSVRRSTALNPATKQYPDILKRLSEDQEDIVGNMAKKALAEMETLNNI